MTADESRSSLLRLNPRRPTRVDEWDGDAADDGDDDVLAGVSEGE